MYELDMSTYRSVNSSGDRNAEQRIADAACQLFAEQGFAATSMRQIADIAGVTKPMVYYYFGSKVSLHQRLVEEAAVAVRATLSAAITSEASCRDKLMRLAEAHAQLAATPATLELAGRAELHEMRTEAIAAVLAEGEQRREIRPVDPHLFAAAFFGGLAAPGRAHSPTLVVEMFWLGLSATA